MYEYIYFSLGKDTIVVNEQQFPLGKLTAEILNLSPTDFIEMNSIMNMAFRLPKLSGH